MGKKFSIPWLAASLREIPVKKETGILLFFSRGKNKTEQIGNKGIVVPSINSKIQL